MKTRLFVNYVSGLVLLVLFGLSPLRIFAGDAPTYRGKVVLIVDNTIDTDTNVSWRIDRLINDLTGDGWRVLRHDVDRGPQHPDDGINTATLSQFVPWAQQNAPRVREVRALIEADYEADPTAVKNVFLIGHVPVPYSGSGSPGVSGGHYDGAQPADAFYGDMASPYGATGWSDLATDLALDISGQFTDFQEFANVPRDGKFDQSVPPAPLSLGVGRVDMFDMPEIWTNSIETNETMLIAQYLDKDHDFRWANFIVQRQAITCADSSGPFCVTPDPFDTIFGTAVTEICASNINLFASVSVTNHLMGYGGDFGNPFDQGGGVATKEYAYNDSGVVFMNLYGSFIGDWDEQDNALRAVLANPYDPTNGKHGYGLTALWGYTFGLDQTSLTNRALGATIGEALFIGYTGNVNYGLMGDPTLRMHSVQEASNLTVSASPSTVTLNWTASIDTNVSSYNVYCSPTSNGPYTLVNTNGVIFTNFYIATRPAIGGVPDNFYMVRAIKPETTPVGNYVNMSEGVTMPVSSTFTPYLSIESQPVNEKVAARTQDGVSNAAAFSVDAVGCDALGNPNLTYQWYEGSNALSDNSHYRGANTSALLITGLLDSDGGNYYVVVSNSFGVVTSSNVTLTINDSPIAVNDSYAIIRNRAVDLDVLTNDTDPDDPNSALSLISISSLDNDNAGTITINPDGRTIHFISAASFIGTTTFTYVVSDGFTASQATVTLNVVPNPLDQPPVVNPSPIPDQTLSQYAAIDIPFSVSDLYTPPTDLQIWVRSSDLTLIPDYNLVLTQDGTNNVLHIRASAYTGTYTVTLTIQDYDLQVTTLSFALTITSAGVPALVATGLQSDGFHFTVLDSANSTVEIKESSDFVTWTSLGNVTLSGGLTNFIDASAGSATSRFYSVTDANGCSVNTIGFINITVPARNSVGGAANVALANQLDNPRGNTFDVLFGALPKGSVVSIFNADIQSLVSYNKGGTNLAWSPATNAINPGQAAWVHAGGTNPVVVTLVGDVPQGQQVTNFTTIAGNAYEIGSIIPLAGTLDQLGFPVQEGDQIQKLGSDQRNWTTVATYSDGQWSPASPSVQVGESFRFISGVSTNRTWTENLPTCAPIVALTSPTDGRSFVGPSSIVLSATATADAGISNVEFFEGNTPLGLGTLNGNSYTRDWIGPPAGIYSITAHVTDNNGITTISFPANITIQPSLGSESYSAGNFQFTISGSAGVSADVKASTDLTNWTSLGTVTLTGGSYNYTDTGAGSFAYRFYRVRENGVCSANTIGFVTVTVPAQNSTGGQAYAALANPLNNPAGSNTLDVLFGALPKFSEVEIWDTSAQTYSYVYGKGGTPLAWNGTAALNPGMGALVHAGGTTPVVVTFVGDVPEGQQVNNFTTTAGENYMLSSIIPYSGMLNQIGFPAQAGDQIQKYNNAEGNSITVATYDGTNWNPALTGSQEPTVLPGESFYLISGATTNRTWTENLPTCMPDVALTSPTNSSTFVGPGSITSSATATADAGIAQVRFYQGATLLGAGTPNGSSYTFNWSNPTTGTFSITAHATDNDGITTISLPVNINIYAQPTLGSESYSNGDFQFTINGSDGVTVDLFTSTNLVTWNSLDTVTLARGSSNYLDTAAGSFTQRFYRVQENGVCSANTIGFVTVTVPAQNSTGGEAYAALANPLNNPAGSNTLDVLFGALPKFSEVEIWDTSAQTYSYVYGKGGTPLAWNGTAALNPGMGALVHAGGTTPVVVTFVGDVPEGQQVNSFTTTAGGNYMLSSIIPFSGMLNQIGFPAQAGDQIQKYNNAEGNSVTVATYDGTNWNPAVPGTQEPMVQPGESFYILSGATTNRTWTEILSPCP